MAAALPQFKAAEAYYGGNTMVALGEGGASPFERTHEISCPLLFHFGQEDANPSPEDMQKIDAELTRHNKVHEFHTYPVPDTLLWTLLVSVTMRQLRQLLGPGH